MEVFSLPQQSDEFFLSSAVYQNDNANTNLAVLDNLYSSYDSHAVLSSNDQPFEYNNNNNNNNNNYQSISFSNDINGQIDIDLNDVLLKSDLLLQRLNSTVSRMSLDEDICFTFEDERDLLHEQLPLDTFENLMREIQHEYG